MYLMLGGYVPGKEPSAGEQGESTAGIHIQVNACCVLRSSQSPKKAICSIMLTQILPLCSVDAWAIGILGYELIVGHPPFERETRTDTYEQIMYRRPNYPAWISEELRLFISAALTKVWVSRVALLSLTVHGRLYWLSCGTHCWSIVVC